MAVYVTAIHTFVAEHSDELEFQAGDKIEVLEKDELFNDGWWKGRNSKGEEGLFPEAYISSDPNAVPLGGTPGMPGDAIQSTPAAAPEVDEHATPIPVPPSPQPPVPVSTPPPTAPEQHSGINGLASPFVSGPPARAADENRDRNSLLDPTGAPRGAALSTTAAATAANSNVMGHTIGEVQEAIDTIGAPSDTPERETAAPRGVTLKDPGVSGVTLTDPGVQRVQQIDDADDDDDEDDIGIGSDARARLAQQAKLANEERDRQQRESGGVADLIYSDESEDEDGSENRGSRSFRGLSMNANGNGPTRTIDGAMEEVNLSDDRDQTPVQSQIPPAPEVDHSDFAAPPPPPGVASGPTSPTPENGLGGYTAGMAAHVPYPPTQMADLQTTDVSGVQQTHDDDAKTPVATSTPPARTPDHSTSNLLATGAGVLGAGALGGAAASMVHSSSQQTLTPKSVASPPTQHSALEAPVHEPIPSPSARSSSLPSHSPASVHHPLPSNTPPLAAQSQVASQVPAQQHFSQQAPSQQQQHPTQSFGTSPRAHESAQLQPALPIAGSTYTPPPQATETLASHTYPSAPPTVATMSHSPSMNSPAQPSSGAVSPATAARMPAKPPVTWTVEEVVQWAQSRGFDDVVCGKFTEHDISGDVLLELDANLLKELEIPQLGKRLRIASAINELRRPTSSVSNQSQNVLTPVIDSTSNHSSRNYSTSTVPPSAFTVPTSTTTPTGSPVVDEHHAWAHGRKVSVTPTTQSIDESRVVETPPAREVAAEKEEIMTSEAAKLAASTTAARPVNGHSATRSTSSMPGTPATSSKDGLIKRESTGSLSHKRNKGSVDKTDRLSFFGRNRKPPPAGSQSPSERAPSSRLGFSHSKPAMTTMTTDRPEKRVSSSGGPSIAIGGAAMRQIGKPDKSGYLKKRGERYGTWKERYFALKGTHLYYLKSEREDRVKGHIDLKGHRIVVDENVNPGSYGFGLVGPSSEKPHYFSSTDQAAVRKWMKALMKATIARDYTVPVTSSCNIPTIPLAEAQALQPRPPSPAERDATQRANRRENVNQLTPRDASVLMSLDTTGSGRRMTSHGSTLVAPNQNSPSRPSRDLRRPSTSKASTRPSVQSYYAPEPTAEQTELLQWVNRTLPRQYPRAANFPTSFISGEVIFLLVKHLSNIEPNPPVPSSAFAPDATGLPNVEGLLAMGEIVIDAGVDSVGPDLNEVRAGDVTTITQLLESVRTWARTKGAA